MNNLLATLISSVITFSTVPAVSSPVTEVNFVQSPKLVRIEKPVYPEFALRTKAEGNVMVEVMVGKDGKAKRARIVSSASPVFDPVVIAAAMNAEYRPAVTQEGAVETWLRIPFSFKRQ